MNCANCAHYRPIEDGDMLLEFGECRLNPPCVLMTDDGPASIWPQVEEGEGCGQFKGKQ